jgi:hypothetical protein
VASGAGRVCAMKPYGTCSPRKQMTLRRWLYEHSPQAECLLREFDRECEEIGGPVAKTKPPQFSGNIIPVSVRVETPVVDVPHPVLGGSKVIEHTGEEIVIVNCGDQEFRFSSWYGVMQ